MNEELPPGILKEEKIRAKIHNDILKLFVETLHYFHLPVNYDHITTKIKKDKKTPLTYMKCGKAGKADIAIRIDEDTYALIEIEIRNINEELKKVMRYYAQKEKEEKADYARKEMRE